MFFKLLLRSTLCLFSAACLQATMTPSAPVKNFRFPHFGENGYTEWVLRGSQGHYDSAEQIRVEDMALRLYSGDERMVLEMTLDSPEATIRLEENRAYSDSQIVIVGENFKVSGVGWTWNGETNEIEVRYDTVVEFDQALSNALMVGGAEAPSKEAAATASEDGGASVTRTVIHSHRLVLLTTEESYHFEFTNAVHAVSGGFDLKSDRLVALADTPETTEETEAEIAEESTASSSKIGESHSIREAVAEGSVVIEEAGRMIRAGYAEFFPREDIANLSGSPQIETASGYLSGETIHRRGGELLVLGGEGAGRAQLIILQAGGLGIQGAAEKSADTIVLADEILLKEVESENHFFFDGNVEVMSGAVQMHSDTMKIFAANDAKESSEGGDVEAGAVPAEPVEQASGGVKVGKVRRAVAEGSVRIDRGKQVATSDKVVFYPKEERAELTGNPRVTNSEAVVSGDVMNLKPGLAIVEGSAEERVMVILPVMPDLGYVPGAEKPDTEKSGLSAVTGAGLETAATSATLEGVEIAEGAPSVDAPAPEETIILSRTLHMIEEPEQTLFRFTGDVEIQATNLTATSDRLLVTAKEQEASSSGGASDLSHGLEVEKIEAFDNVVVQQDGRVVTGDKATILPLEGKLMIEGHAVVQDDRGKVTGHRLIFLQGERRAIVEGGGPTGERAKITLPEIMSKDF